MKQELKEYQDAINEHIFLKGQQTQLKLDIDKSHYRVLRAKEELRAKEWELLNNYESVK